MNRALSLATAFSLFGLLSLAACTAGVAQGDGTTGDDQEVVQGKMCGGIAGLRCKAGLTCRLSGNFPDASGTCVTPQPGELDALCGGIAGLGCHAGLSCKFPSHGPPPGAMGMPMADESGTCQKSSGPPPGAVGLPKPQK